MAILTQRELAYLRSLPESELEDWLENLGRSKPEIVPQIIEELNNPVHVNAAASEGYYSRSDLAKTLDISPETIDRWRRLGCPYKSNGDSKAADYDLVDCFRWYIQNSKKSPGTEDPTKKIERQVKHETLITKRMQRKELQKQLVRAQTLRGELKTLLEMLREIGGALEKNHGRDALDLFNEGLDEVREHLIRGLEDDS